MKLKNKFKGCGGCGGGCGGAIYGSRDTVKGKSLGGF